MKNWIHHQFFYMDTPYNEKGTAYVIQPRETGGEDAAAKVRAVAEEIAGVQFVPVKPPFGFGR